MKRKNRSIKISHMSLINTFQRRLTAHPILFNSQQHQQNIADIASIIEEITHEAIERANFNSQALNNYRQVQNLIINVQESYRVLQRASEQEDVLCDCERQPQIGIHLFGKNNNIQTTKPTTINKLLSFRSKHFIKSKSKSCDIIAAEEQKKNYLVQTKHPREVSKGIINRLIPLDNLNRQSIDHSQQIQQLMRKNKLLQIQPKQERINTQLSKMSKRSRTDRKEKKYYFHDDDGKAQEISCSLKNNDFKTICLGEVRAMPGQNLLQGLKKRAIVEHITINKRKKRRKDIQLGDTCVLIEQIKQTECLQNQTPVDLSCCLRKGVRLIRNSTIQVPHNDFRLPTLR